MNFAPDNSRVQSRLRTRRQNKRITVLSLPSSAPVVIAEYYRGLSDFGIDIVSFNLHNAFRRYPDIFHIHWPEAFIKGNILLSGIRLLLLIAYIEVANIFGVKIIRSFHNARSHDGKFRYLEICFLGYLTRRLSLVHALADASVDLILKTHPGVPIVVIPHISYCDFYNISRLERLTIPHRHGLQPSKYILFFGLIRRYKGLDVLIRAFRRDASQASRMMIAGKPQSEDLLEEIQDLCSDDQRITLILRHISDAEIPDIFSQCRLVVLPYVESLNSGVAILSASFGAPTLARGNPVMREYSKRWPSLFYLYDDDLRLDFDASQFKVDPHELADFRKHHSPERVRRLLAQAYRDLEFR